MEKNATIRIKGARQHNLRNLDLEIPRNQLVVVTGLSGSGKSSLAFDTLYAEGQRKYVESLSAYARQFLDRMQKPDVDYIEGLSPAIAIEQRSSTANPRSTIATTTEIYDYLRLFFAAVGQPHDPATGALVARQTPQEMTTAILAYGEGTKLMLLAPLVSSEKGEFRDVIEKARRDGFVRLRLDGTVVELDSPTPPRLDRNKAHNIEAVVDRIVLREDIRSRLADSVETALRWGLGKMTLSRATPDTRSGWTDTKFSTDYSNPATGFTMPQLTPRHFSFNSHLGACPACHGLGNQPHFDPELLIASDLTLDEGAIRPWKTSNARMKVYYAALLDGLIRADSEPIPRNVPFEKLPLSFRVRLVSGSGDHPIEFALGKGGKTTTKPFEGLLAQVEHLYQTSQSELTRKRLRAWQNQHTCTVCQGTRLRPEILAVTVQAAARPSLNIQQFCSLTVAEAARLDLLTPLSDSARTIVGDVLREISRRLEFLKKVGLGYLTLDRESGTLSGGEAQRIRLATQIGAGLAGVLYVLDEPSIGLHQCDNDRLLDTLRSLRDLGNSVIVVEHDEETIRAADYIIDMGPGAGPQGGEIIAAGTLEEVLKSPRSTTAAYLAGRQRIAIPKKRIPPHHPLDLTNPASEGWLTILGASENNLRNIDASFPLSCLTCVTGVSGSGKSTLIQDILHNAIARDLHRAKARPGAHREIRGTQYLDKIVTIDQSPIGRTPRSNPATYSGALAPIRDIFAELPASRVRGYSPGRFSINTKGGRCEHCEGNGLIKIEMHFLADVYVECEICRGRRFNRETLEVTYKGKNIADVLEMTIDEAARFFRNIPVLAPKLDTMLDVGLGYLKLGQSATTLSGGEAQRLKLASELARRSTGRTLYILDEPTTGLHFADIQRLLQVLFKLRDARNTLIVIEHNLDVIKCADWVLDLGPEGGSGGGLLVAAGTPETVAAHPASITARYLRKVLS